MAKTRRRTGGSDDGRRDPQSMAPPITPIGDPPEVRYTPIARIAEGGMGEVRRVHDQVLGREVAQKLLLWDHLGDSGLSRRFEEETRIVASLEHPGIPPVHDAGRDADGRPWLVMREVRGSTLRAKLDEPADSLSALWRRIALFLRAVEAVAFAHARGVIHGDLKPENVMVGAFGEVQVIDWGLAQRVDARSPPLGLGTPGYLAPELGKRGPHPGSDVFALGVCLGEVLRSVSVVHPEELAALVASSTAAEPEVRPANAGILAMRVAAWLDGSSHAVEADRLVAEAAVHSRAASEVGAEGLALTHRAARELAEAPRWEPLSPEKRRAWRTLEAAEDRARVAREHDASAVVRLEAALALVPTHPDAHAALAIQARRELEAAEAADHPALADSAERRLRAHDRTGAHQAWLVGDGSLSLDTASRVEVLLHRLVLDDRRLVPVLVRSLGTTPLEAVPLPRGSWLLELCGPGPSVQVPVRVGRQEHVAPPPADSGPLWLPKSLAPQERYVPAGWCRVGGDAAAIDALPPCRVWLRGFIALAHPVTNGEYLAFLHDLDREEDVSPWLPRRTRADAGEGPRPPVFVRDGAGVWRLPDDASWTPVTPVVQVTWHAARRYARWLADRTGLPWRLPHGLEREKMARGADGRRWPWGDHEDPTWFCNLRATDGRPGRTPVHAFPLDMSVYGISGLAGNVRDWCGNGWERDSGWVDGQVVEVGGAPSGGELAEVRGGAWSSTPQFCRPAGRFANALDDCFGACGFRLVRSVPN